MNQYGATAMRHWQTYLPQAYAELDDPAAYFLKLGQRVSAQIADLAEDLIGKAPAGETFEQKVGRIEAAKRQAREKVMAEEVFLPAEPGREDEELPEA
jgi:hypothetical protein